MQKNLFYLLILLAFQNSFSQTDLKLNKKKKFISINEVNNEDKNNIEDYIIMDIDTLVSIKPSLTKKEFERFCSCYTNDSLKNKYAKAVFRVAMDKGEYRKSIQWNSKIDVYLDKSIPKNARKKFKKFYQDLKETNSISISFVKNMNGANYIIKASDTLISHFSEEDSRSRESYPLSKIEYNLFRDDNDKTYGGVLMIDLDNLKDKSLILPKLKQVFFLSLGQFIVNRTFSKTSLLSTNYENNDTISDSDLQLLKMHYIKIFDQPFTLRDYNKLRRRAKAICNNE